MKRLGVAVSSALLALVGFAPVAHAEEDTRPCVTRDEFENASWDWTKERVNGKFDSDGVRAGTIIQPDGDEFRIWRWETCNDVDEVLVYFKVTCCALRLREKHWDDFSSE